MLVCDVVPFSLPERLPTTVARYSLLFSQGNFDGHQVTFPAGRRLHLSSRKLPLDPLGCCGARGGGVSPWVFVGSTLPLLSRGTLLLLQ